jgi:hypothetical protein
MFGKTHLLPGEKSRVRRTSVPGPEKATTDAIDLVKTIPRIGKILSQN